MVRRGRGLVDGRGAIRVAAAMREALLRLRPASLDDEQLLLDWRNDPETRTASFETAIVPPAVHRAWLEASLTSADRVMRIGEVGGRPVGVVRLDRRGDEAVVSITVAPTARGSGLANALLLQARSLADQVGISRLRARIRRTNVASIRAFAAAGFVDSPSEVGADDAVTMVTPSAGRR
jgi:RimJ/RimL family protein N-acetyltransferase